VEKVPWTVADVESKKKGLTPEQKKKWVNIANAILKDCIAKGGTDKTCAPKAIRIANSKFEEETMKAPKSAFNFVDPEAFAKVDENNNVDIVAYSGKIIKGHWYWGDLAIDVMGAEFPKKFYPILEQHDLTRKVGFSTKPLTDNNQLTFKNVTFVDTPASQEFQTISKQGFPFEASISGRPSIVEQIEDGESAEVNGYKFKGPGSIWRKWTYKETSVCVFGADGNTKSKVLAEGDEEIEVSLVKKSPKDGEDDPTDKNKKTKEEVKTVDLKELKEKDAVAYDALMAEAKAAVKPEIEQTFTQEKTTLTVKMGELNTKLEDASKKILAFEKTETIRKENELRQTADGIWETHLKASDIPEHLFAKVKTHVSYEKFIKEGVFDEAAFTKAVADEIADWVKGGVSKQVMGTGFSQKEVAADTKLAADDDKAVEEMLALAGQKKK
jgi:hypothetical protein